MMNLQISVPTSVLFDRPVAKIVAEGDHGNFCILPRHTDYLSTLVPGILILTDDRGKDLFFAVDHGLLVKQGLDVSISVRRAVQSEDLEALHWAVRERFLQLDENDRASQTAVASLEANFLRMFLKMQEEPLS